MALSLSFTLLALALQQTPTPAAPDTAVPAAAATAPAATGTPPSTANTGAAAGVSGRGAPKVALPRLEAEVRIDGVLDEPVWREAVRLTGFSQYQPVDGRPAEERTEVLVWYSATAIHFGILAYDRQPGAVRATVADRDNVDGDDNVTIYLDTFNDRRRAYFFTVNPLGVQQDGVRSEAGSSAGQLFSGNLDKSPDYLFQSKGRRTPEGYVVEVRIPFKSLRYPSSSPQAWGINFVRVVKRTGYQDTWTDVRRANASFLTQSATLDGLHDMRAGIVMEAQPFVTARADGATDQTSGAFDRTAIDPSTGLNLKLARANMALDATWNPDFSQVEADAGVATVNERFDIFFAERRPFFLEGIELFATPNQLVYTRRIADPIAGGKITGKFGRLGLAHLTALDEHAAPGDANALFNVTRLRTDFGGTSTAGVTLTDRRGGGSYNTVAEADTRYVFGKLYYFQPQFGYSWTRDSTGGAERRDPIWQAELDRTGRAWGFNYLIEGVGGGFESRSGFVPRTGIVQAHVMNRLTLYGARGALVENVTAFFGPSRIWSYDSFLGESAIEGSDEINLNLNVRGGWLVSSRASRGFVEFDPATYAGYTVNGANGTPFAPPAKVDNAFAGRVDVKTPAYRQFNAEVEAEFGETALFDEAAEGRLLGLTGGLALRPTRSVRTELTTTLQRLTRLDGSEFARTFIPRLRVEYQPNRALFFRVIGEYRSERRAALQDPNTGAPLFIDGAPAAAVDSNRLRLDWLASFEPTPGTVAFLGYGALYATEPGSGFTFNGLQRTQDGFFVKFAYLFRR